VLDVMITWTTDMVRSAVHLPVLDGEYVTNLAQVPEPGGPQRPPGDTEFLTLLQYAMWFALAACIAGLFVLGGRMAINHQRGEGGSHMGSLAIVGFGCVVIVTAQTIVSQIAE
jgi:hypothetical protein